MKKSSLALFGLSACVLVVGLIAADTKKAAPAPTAPVAEKQQKLVRVSTLKTVEANQEFQTNVQKMQAQRQAAVELNTAFEKETNAAKKKELKAKVDEALAALNSNNQAMMKAYGFSLDRNYTLVIETAHIYMLVSDEEAAKIEKEQPAAAPKK
jgi:hypothetical protein